MTFMTNMPSWPHDPHALYVYCSFSLQDATRDQGMFIELLNMIHHETKICEGGPQTKDIEKRLAVHD